MVYARTSSVSDLRKFIHDLREALRNAEQSGGGYSAFLHDPERDAAILQVEIAPKVRPKT